MFEHYAIFVAGFLLGMLWQYAIKVSGRYRVIEEMLFDIKEHLEVATKLKPRGTKT